MPGQPTREAAGTEWKPGGLGGGRGQPERQVERWALGPWADAFSICLILSGQSWVMCPPTVASG